MQRRVVRRATPATLTGVAGRPTMASACDIQDPRVTREAGSVPSAMAKARAQAANVRMRGMGFVLSYRITRSPMAFTVTEAGSSCLAPAGGVNTKRAASAGGARFQLRSCSVYCGAPGTVLLMIT